MNSEAPALVIAQSQRAREGLVTLLAASPEISTIGQVADETLAMDWVIGHTAGLVVVDARGGGQDKRRWDALQALLTIRAMQIKFVVLVSDENNAARAWAAGADEVLLTGFSASIFYSVLKQLIMPCEEKVA